MRTRAESLVKRSWLPRSPLCGKQTSGGRLSMSNKNYVHDSRPVSYIPGDGIADGPGHYPLRITKGQCDKPCGVAHLRPD